MHKIRPVFYTDELKVGLTAVQSKTITETDIILFSGISTDVNAVHINEEYAKTTIFGKRIAHGFLAGSLISSALANQLPGPGTILLEQNMKFLAPVHAGDTVRAVLEVVEVNYEKNKVKIKAQCFVGDKMVIDGMSYVKSTARPA